MSAFEMNVDISDLLRASEDFRAQLPPLKARAAPESFPWYPYDSLSNFVLLDRLLTGNNRNFSELAGKLPILDIGCADGTTSFVLERAGFDVEVIDNPPTNFNGMAGLRALKEALHSNVAIHSADLDSQFTIPRERYGMVLFLGLLYHLKNPYFALETLSARARFCLLSTRIAKYGPDRKRLLEDLPLAYLVAPQETNNDATNFWIFSKTGLERLFSRTGWRVRDYLSVGNVQNSDPASVEGDERAFCLIESERFPDAPPDLELLSGWYGVEQGSWRWTSDRFSARILSPGSQAHTLVMRFFLPESGFTGGRHYQLHVAVEGREVAVQNYDSPGQKTLRVPIGKAPAAGEPLMIECSLDPPQPPAAGDPRVLGLIVTFFDQAGNAAPDPFRLVRDQ
jgi:tRNA (mo5U34)-methyltransferase